MKAKKSPLIGILNFTTSEEGDRIVLRARCVIKMQGSREPVDTDKIRIDFPVMTDAAEIRFSERFGRKLPRGFSLNSFELSIDRGIENALDIQNKFIVNYDGEYEGRILYSMADLKTGHNKNSEVYVRDGVAMYFRQSRYNSLTLTVRDTNIYDTTEGQARIKRAYAQARRKKLLGRLPGGTGSGRNSKPIMMYEKNCARFEESASVLYKKLIDAGYDNVYFVVNKGNPEIADLPERYRRNLVWKDSDRHLELMFESDTYISTESTEHALQLRAASKHVMDKIRSRDLKYVFLQHGVMYMVSLNSDMRTGFRNNDHDFQRTVVSSELEASHFTELAGMKHGDLYVTGLAKYDESFRYDDADRIVIMLTWRRWETNQARDDLENTGYYRMMKRIYDSVPDELKDKVVVLPHPLMADRFKETADFGGRVHLSGSYDKVLQQTDLLITDYSSIAYDAFYRGANVLFCWSEKDECMEHYGEGTYLMLNEDNVFGDVCMDGDEIREAAGRNYKKPQPDKYKERYSRIVEFHDGNNSQRIIESLRADRLID